MGESLAPGTVSPTHSPTDPSATDLDTALRAAHHPLENTDLVRAFTRGLGLTSFVRMASYIKAPREGAPDLHIYSGYTNGFSSREEIEPYADHHSIWESDRGRGQWGVTHPSAERRRSGDPERGAAKPHVPEHVQEVCPSCYQVKSVSGVCGCW